MSDTRKLAFIGGGHMAAALIGGMLKHGFAAAGIFVADPSRERREELARNHGVNVTPDNSLAVDKADVVILAVKPQQMRAVALQLSSPVAQDKPLIISIAAGISYVSLSRWFGPTIDVIRGMPNRPALDGFGATGLYAPPTVSLERRQQAQSILGAVGCTVWVDAESQMDTVTALSGSGPAYFFLFMEALEAAAQARGLSQDVAHRLTLETAFGAAQMARTSGESLTELRKQVTSAGGTTAAALAVFDHAGLRSIVADALFAADRRSAELAVEFGAA